MLEKITDSKNKTKIKNGKKCGALLIYLKTKEEINIWETLKARTLKEISDGTGLNITRIFRLKSFGGMLLIERDIFNNYIQTEICK